MPARTSTTAAFTSILLILGCSTSSEPVGVRVGPSLLFPKGVLDQVTHLTLRAFDSTLGVTCDTDSGLVSGDTSSPLLEEELGSDGCAGGVRFCGDVTIKRASTSYVFSASAENDDGKLLATGCVDTVIDAAEVDLAIDMRHYLEPATCGNGTLEPTELCDPPGSPDATVCNSQCQTEEVLLSNGSGDANGTQNGKAGDKQRPALVWPSGKGTASNLIAMFSDSSPATQEVTLRVRSDAFGRFGGQGAEVADFSFFLPTTPGASFPPKESPGNQSAPAGASVNGHTWIAFEDDTSGDLDIRLRSIDTTMTAEQSAGAFHINGTVSAGEAGTQSLPTIAANSQGILFIAWQDDRDGSIHGRTFNPDDSTLGATRLLGTGSANKNVRVTALGSGFLAVWESGSDVKLARLSPDGTPSPEEAVNGAAHTAVSHPSVASLSDGRFAIAFTDRGDIFIQRYGTDGKALSGDQDSAVNALVTQGDQYAPVLASSASAGGSYALAWVDGPSGDIRAAYLGGSGEVLFNPVDGQATEFLVSSAEGRTRANPAIVIGGSGPYVVVAWEDTSSDSKAGIYGRRLPVPAL